MKNLYALTPGEFLVGERLQQRGFAVYFPLKDVGVDLLAEKERRHSRIQVKESRVYRQRTGRVPWSSWTQLRAETLRTASEQGVDFFVFVVHAFAETGNRLRFSPFYVVIPPKELDRRLGQYRRDPRDRAVYWYREGEKLWEVRQAASHRITQDYHTNERDFTQFLEAWHLLTGSLHSSDAAHNAEGGTPYREYDERPDQPGHEARGGHARS